MNKPTQQQVIDAYKQLPPPVQEFLADPDQLAQVLSEIKNVHGLHIDVIGQVNESIGYLLLGLVNSNEFKDMLKIAGVPEGIIASIVDEINKKIFLPLREQMKNLATVTSKPEEPLVEQVKSVAPPVAWSATPTPAPRPVQVNAPVPSYAYAKPKQSSPQFFHLENKIPPPLPTPTPQVPPPTEKRGQTSLPTAPSTKMLEDREEPHIALSGSEASTKQDELKRALAQVVPSQIAPLRMAEVRQPNKAEVPANLPGIIQPPTPSPEVVAPKVEPQTPIIKQYVGDPYREPIDTP